MPVSQYLQFSAVVPEDVPTCHPLGAALMRRLSTELSAAGWSITEMENWRDCGWSIDCRRSPSDLQVTLSWVRRGYWVLRVSPRRVPGAIGCLFGFKSSASPEDVHQLAVAVHQGLSALKYLCSPRWQWDGFPDDRHSTPEPQPAK